MIDARHNKNARVRQNTHASRSAFTMIELLIVMLIIPVVTIAFFGLIELLNVTHERSMQRINARQASGQALTSWRQDVRVAESISLGAEGKTMTVSRFDREGRPLVVRYETTSEGGLARVIEEGLKPGQPPRRVFCKHVRDLKFQQTGRSFRIGWTIEQSDGAQTWRWSQEGWAAPLAPRQEGER